MLIKDTVKELSNEQLINLVPAIGAIKPFCEVSENIVLFPRFKL